jgi:DNA helicase TIP49 (TBP-interacting protein)
MPNMAFANDIAVLSMRCREELVALTNEALNIVARWIEGASLRLAVQKTEGILLLGNRRMREVKFEVAGVEVKAQELH